MDRKLRVEEYMLPTSMSTPPDDVKKALNLSSEDVSPLVDVSAVRASLAAAVQSIPDDVLARYQGGKMTIVM